MLCPTQWVESSPLKDGMFGNAAEWNADFKVAHPSYTAVPYQTAQASAAVLVYKEAFEAANSFDQVKVRDAIAATDMETFYGNIKFSEAGNNIAKPMFMRQISGGSYNAIITADDMVFPRKASY